MEKVLRVIKFDFITCRKTIIFLIGYFFVFGLYLEFSTRDLQIIPVSIMFWFSMVAGFPFTLRDKYGLDNLLATFPINRKIIIRSRFLFSMMVGVLGIALSEIMVCISAVIFSARFDLKNMFFILCISFVLYCIILAIHMPLYFRYTHTMPIQVSPLFLYIIYIISLQLYYTGRFYIDMGPVIEAAWRFPVFVLAVTLLLALGLLFLSYNVACKVYINKDL